jgi:hypothetical protein
VKPLDGDLPEVLLDAEVDELVVLYLSVIIFVVPEDVLHKVVDLLRVLVHHGDQKVANLLLLKLLVLIFVELDELDVNQLSHLEG